jgi:hypothetical protein
MRKSYIQDPVTFELIPREEYYSREVVNAPMVMADIQPYKSMINGEMITSRSQHRSHLKQHGMVEIGNEVKAHMATKQSPQPDRAGIRRDLIETMRRKNYL